MHSTQIRGATVADAGLIALLGRITFADTFGHLFSEKDLEEYLEMTFSYSKIHNSLQKTDNRFWLAFYNNLPVGYAKLKLNCPHPELGGRDLCQLQKIYVQKAFLDKRIGHLLLNAAMDAFLKNDARRIWLSVLESNARAIHFYEKNGWIKRAKHRHQIGEQVFHFELMVFEKEH